MVVVDQMCRQQQVEGWMIQILKKISFGLGLEGFVDFALHADQFLGGWGLKDIGVVEVFVKFLDRSLYQSVPHFLLHRHLSAELTHQILQSQPTLRHKQYTLKLFKTTSQLQLKEAAVISASSQELLGIINLLRMKAQQEYKPDWVVSVEDKKDQNSSLDLLAPLSLPQQSPPKYCQQVQKQFDSVDATKLSEVGIELQIEKVRSKLREFELIVSRKIDKYYPQLRPQPHTKTETVDSLLQSLKNELQLRNKLIEFQLSQINEIQEREKLFDARANIEFAIPLQISDTKRKIEELERFIHVAEIKQKKKSEDLVKVDRNNLHQFERTALLRTNLEVAMLYQINLNEREAKIDDHIYDFDKKLSNLDKKLQDLAHVVQQRHIPVSSNKNLLALKDKKLMFLKCRDDETKKLMLLNSNIAKAKANLAKEIEKLKQEIKQKEQRHEHVVLECQQLQTKNTHFLNDQDLGKSLRKSISFNYAQTLLKMKKNQSALIEKPNPLKLASKEQLEKPNFKIRKTNLVNYSSLEKFSQAKKQRANLNDITLPITHLTSKKKTEHLQLPNPELRTSRKQRSSFDMRLNKSREKSEQEEEIIQEY